LQNKRYSGIKGVYCNAQLTDKLMNKFCEIDNQGNQILKSAVDKLKLSARSYSRIRKVARTIADMEQSEKIKAIHIAEAIQYRGLDRMNSLN
jgi:magnesium chelatase family protein